MKELIEYFLQELPSRIESVRAAHQAGDAASLKRLVHQLRGASAGYGFPQLGTAAGKVEDRLRGLTPETAGIPEALAKIGADVNQLIDMCRRACAS
jgi:HPt (histidine-containing phosphotransfer) domain-containing protein